MFNEKIAIDIGSSYTTIYQKGKGIVLREPSVIAVKKNRNKLKLEAIGMDAIALLNSGEKSDDVFPTYPFTKGRVANHEAAVLMVKAFLETISTGKLIRPSFSVIATITCGLTFEERTAFEKVFMALGIDDIVLVESPIAISTYVENNSGIFVIIGSHLTEIAVVNESGIVTGCSIDISGTKLDDAVVKYVKDNYRVVITREGAETLRKSLGSLTSRSQNTMEISGESTYDATNKRIDVTSLDVKNSIMPIFDRLADVIGQILTLVPPAIDNKSLPIIIAGGVAKTHGINDFFRKKLNRQIKFFDDENAIAQGASKFFGKEEILYHMLGIKS